MSRWSTELVLNRNRIVLLGAILLLSVSMLLPRAFRESASETEDINQDFLRSAIENSPADRELLSLVAEQAFDIDLKPGAGEARWRLAALTLRSVAAGWLPGKVRVLRAGLFHWPELSAAGRELMREEAQVLLQDQQHFEELALPLYRLNGDITFLLANSPRKANSYNRLVQMSLMAEKFEDYRLLRDKAPAHFEAVRKALLAAGSSGDEFLHTLLAMPLSDAMIPVARAYLDVLAEHSPSGEGIDSEALSRFLNWAQRAEVGPIAPLFIGASLNPGVPPSLLARIALSAEEKDDALLIEAKAPATRSLEWSEFQLDLADYAVRKRDLPSARGALSKLPVDGTTTLRALAVRESVAQLAGQSGLAGDLARERLERFGPESAPARWAGFCAGGALCGRSATVELTTKQQIEMTVTFAPEVIANGASWIELRDYGMLIAESEIGGITTLRSTIPPGDHSFQIEVMNAVNGSGGRRTVILRSSSFEPSRSSSDAPQRQRQ